MVLHLHGEGLGREGDGAPAGVLVGVGVDESKDVGGAGPDAPEHHHHPQELGHPLARRAEWTALVVPISVEAQINIVASFALKCDLQHAG